MNITASIYTDIYAIIILLITMFLTIKNPVGDKSSNNRYISMLALTMILLVLEIFTVLMSLSSSRTLVIPHRIANVLGFALSPVVPFILSCLPSSKKRRFKTMFLHLPLLINIIMCVLSYKTGWIFFVDNNNKYSRGDLFLIPMIISAFYFVFLMLDIRKSIINYKNENNKLIILICFLPIIGAVLQIAFKDILLIWGNMAISLVVYYILLSEIQFRYDPQTGVKNRLAFEKEMKKYSKNEKDMAIVVLDINCLKIINDKYGHKEGDNVIINAAHIIKKSFIDIGETFRIGGDEFCVICEDATKGGIEAALTKFEVLLAIVNKDRKIKIQVAYGYDSFRKGEDESIFSVFSKADSAMYDHKARCKRSRM